VDVDVAWRLLDEARAELLLRLGELERELGAVRLARGDSADDEHDPEGSTLSSDWSRISGMRAALLSRLDEVDAAGLRLRDGDFGSCVRCGDPIAEGRLVALPWTATCVSCAAVR
jgi:RNA polymerase-binding transcription factor DksA